MPELTQSTPKVTAIAAFDINAKGEAFPVADTWPDAEPATGMTYRWLHFDVTDSGLGTWTEEHLPRIAASALLQLETRPRCDQYDDGLILNLRGINMNSGQESDDMVSLRMWVTPTLVVSARVRRVFAADDLRQQMTAGTGPASPGGWICTLSGLLTNRIEQASLDLEEATGGLEDELLDGNFDDTATLMTLRRKVIRLRRYVSPQKDALTRLAQIGQPFACSSEATELREIANRSTRSVEELEATSLRLQALQEFVQGQRAEATSRNGFVLSIVAAIFLPLSFLTGLFGVNVAGMPGSDWPWAFLALTLGSAAIGVALYVYFRHLRWF